MNDNQLGIDDELEKYGQSDNNKCSIINDHNTLNHNRLIMYYICSVIVLVLVIHNLNVEVMYM